MIVAGSASPLLLSSAGGYNLTNSLRFRSSASAYLNRTPASAGNRQIFTWSAWVKKAVVGSSTNNVLFCSTDNSTGTGWLHFNTGNYGSADTLTFEDQASSTALVTTQVFRDVSAWYHIVLAVDTTQATNTNRIKLYVNGLQITAFSTSTYPSQNANTNFNRTSFVNSIGCYFTGTSSFFNGYLAEVNFIDGQALTPSSFGQTSATTGVWIPKKYTGTYGTNGFYLPFTDNSALTTSSNVGLGKDFSGNGNYWTTNNISITSGSTYDSMTDVPTLTSATAANYCVLNPLDKAANFTLAGANLNFTPANTSDLYSCRSTFQIPSTGKWIWEVTNTNSAYMITAGLLSGSTALVGQQTVTCASMTVGSIGTFFSTSQWMNTTTTWSVTNVGNGDTLVIAYDADAGKIWFGRVASGGTTVTWYNTSGTADPSTGTDPRASSITAGGWFAGFGTYYTPSGASANFGQRPFSFTNIPTGFKALNTFNLPTPTIGATASTQANKYFDAITYAGNGQAVSSGGMVISSLNFQPDFVWIKDRTSPYSHNISDVLRGASTRVYSNLTNAEDTNTESVNTFNSNGFTVGNNVGVNTNGNGYAAWNWKANGSGSTNTAGTITSTVSANTSAGFSIVTFTAPSSNQSFTVGHGLGVAPSMVIKKRRDASLGGSWWTWHIGLGDNTTDYLALNTTDAESSLSNMWGTVGRTSTLLGFNVTASCVASETAVVYCFAQVAGYSAFGSYTGNGSSDGPFVFTGFRPKFVMIKSSSTGGAGYDWFMWDSSRNTYNVIDHALWANLSDAENTTAMVDFVSNGFKIRLNSSAMNGNGTTFIYMAFAENPFKYANAR